MAEAKSTAATEGNVDPVPLPPGADSFEHDPSPDCWTAFYGQPGYPPSWQPTPPPG